MNSDNGNAYVCGIMPPKKPKSNGRFRLLFAVVSGGLWDNGTVLNYSFFGGTAQQQGKVDFVIQEWMWYAHITFKRVADNDASATLRITFNPKGGSWSYVGRDALTCRGPEPTINFGWILDMPELTQRERGVILHEFGHVLGLVHEHASPARSGILRVKEKETIQYYKEKMDWDEETTHNQVLDVYSADTVTNYSRFDPASIMIYAMPAFMNEGGVEIFEVTHLSSLDKAFIVANYPRPNVHPNAREWNPGYALFIAGAAASTTAAYHATTDFQEKRAIFTKDMRARRALETEWMGQQELPTFQKIPHKVQRMLDPSGIPSPETSEPPPTQLTRLAAAVIAHPNLKLAINNAVSAAVCGRVDGKVDEDELQFRRRADEVMAKLRLKAGRRGCEKILEAIEHRLKRLG